MKNMKNGKINIQMTKKYKKAEEYYRDACSNFYNRKDKNIIFDESYFIEAIRLAQEDAINLTYDEIMNIALKAKKSNTFILRVNRIHKSLIKKTRKLKNTPTIKQ